MAFVSQEAIALVNCSSRVRTAGVREVMEPLLKDFGAFMEEESLGQPGGVEAQHRQGARGALEGPCLAWRNRFIRS